MANILVTGAGTGFGKGTVLELAQRGHAVTAATFLPAEAEAMTAAHDNITGMVLDVTSADSVAAAADLPLDVLVNNAGRGLMAPLSNVPLDEVRKTFDVNVFGMLAMCQAVIPGMKERGSGRIINVSSIAGVLSGAMSAPYAMTKHAVIALGEATKQVAWDDGVRVTAVCPGFIATDMIEHLGNDPDTIIDAADLAELIATTIALPNSASVAQLNVACLLEPHY